MSSLPIPSIAATMMTLCSWGWMSIRIRSRWGSLNPGHETPDVEKIFHDEESVRRLIGRFGEPGLLRVCYEAGPTGYDLARLLRGWGWRAR